MPMPGGFNPVHYVISMKVSTAKQGSHASQLGPAVLPGMSLLDPCRLCEQHMVYRVFGRVM